MLTYNTQLKKLALPEYGRHIQNMVDYCRTIPDFEERTACAYTIVDTMEQMFPTEGDLEEYRRKLWDHLAIMSEFDLDIDWPFEVVRKDELDTRPEPILLPDPRVPYRHYGQLLVYMVEEDSMMEPSEERDALVMLLANHMKKQLLTFNPDGVDDERVFADIRQITHGAINIHPDELTLYDFKTLPAPKKKKKK
ncbi:MAG: DUF4290 domain-containing protein [Bacteroidales bacterium]|nr:DUF4290 domain-containing protein [Bacteroidales bacterium]